MLVAQICIPPTVHMVLVYVHMPGPKGKFMRDLAKALISSSWAVSLLGIKQAASLLAQSDKQQAKQEVSDSFDPVINTVLRQLDSSMQGIFRAGDGLQKGLVDVAFGFGAFDLLNLNPSWLISGIAKMLSRKDPPEGWGPVSPRS